MTSGLSAAGGAAVVAVAAVVATGAAVVAFLAVVVAFLAAVVAVLAVVAAGAGEGVACGCPWLLEQEAKTAITKTSNIAIALRLIIYRRYV